MSRPFRDIAALALLLLAPAFVALTVVDDQQASLETRVREGQSALKALEAAGRPPGISGARDDFKPLPEAVSLNQRNLEVLRILKKVNLVSILASTVLVFVMLLASGFLSQRGRSFENHPVLLGLVSFLAAGSFLLHGCALAILMFGAELWILGGVTWGLAPLWVMGMLLGILQAQQVFFVHEIELPLSRRFRRWRVHLGAGDTHQPPNWREVADKAEEDYLRGIATLIFRPHEPLVRSLLMAGCLPLLLLGTAAWAHRQASTNLTVYQPPATETWLPNAPLPPAEWVGRAYISERLYEPHVVRQRARGCMALAAIIYTLGFLAFAAIMLYRQLRTAVRGRALRIVSFATTQILRISTALIPVAGLALIAFLWCVDVLLFGTAGLYTYSAVVVLGIGLVAFFLSFLAPDDLPPEERSVDGIVLSAEACPELQHLVMECAAIADTLPPHQIIGVLGSDLEVLQSAFTLAGTNSIGPALLIPLPLCRAISVSEFRELTTDKLAAANDPAPGHAAAFAERAVMSARLNVFTAPSTMLAAPVIFLARLIEAPPMMNPDPHESLLGSVRFKEFAARVAWHGIPPDVRTTFVPDPGESPVSVRMSPGLWLAQYLAEEGFDLWGPDRTPAATLLPDLDSLERQLVRESPALR